jgi:two-component sensor histidine kinase
MSKSATNYHRRAAVRLGRAVEHNGKAAEHHEAGRHDQALRHALKASDYTIRATAQAEKALSVHAECIQLLAREASHRAKNMLCLVQTIARQTATAGPKDFIRRFTERLQALAANQDLLVRNEWRGVDVDELVRAQLGHFADLIGLRIALHGPTKLHLNAAATEAIGLALHELATNAGKYGALSVDAGHIDVSWGVHDDMFAMSWTEHNGPPVARPKRLGFGSTIITSLTKLTISGEAQLDCAPSGVTWHLICPAVDALEACERKID